MEEEEEVKCSTLPSETTSLFPAFSYATGQTTTGTSATWLQNPSFTTDLSIINDAVSKYADPFEEQEQLEEPPKNEKSVGQYSIIQSSSSDEDSARKGRKKEKKRRKIREESNDSRSHIGYGVKLSSSDRQSAVKKWEGSSLGGVGKGEKEYYFDSSGDRDNLVFGSIYRMDVARYKPYNAEKSSERRFFRRNKRADSLEGDSDVDALDTKLRSGGRYWSAKYAAVERHKNLKRLRVLASSKDASSSVTDYMPLQDELLDSKLASSLSIVEESWEDEVLRKTKEFNKITRERPHDESVWLAFAEFQDKVSDMRPQKAARLQALEKKISILEKATELNPESEDLLLSLMKAYQRRDSSDLFLRRWEKILSTNSGSYRLWREFLRVIHGEFSRFKVSDLRKMYANAIQALAGACIKQHRQAQPTGNTTHVDPATVQIELGLVDVFLGLCRLEWQAGYQELATALFQAEIEYCLFCPLGLSEQSKHRLFEHFWSSNGARIGEDGALGWSSWLEKEEEQRQRLIKEETSETVEEGGWTGWFQPLSKTEETEIPESQADENMELNELDDDSDSKNVEQKDDVDSLLRALGIDATAEADIKINDTKTWTRWSKTETERDSDHWMPLRAASGDGEDDEQLLSVVLFEDVSDYLFSLNSEEAQMSLVCQFIDFYEGRIPQWTCSNSSSSVEKALSLEIFPECLLANLRMLHYLKIRNETDSISGGLELLLGSSDDTDMKTNMMKFLRNASLLCLKVFPQNYILEEAALVSEELSNTRMNTTSCSVTPCRALAKILLKNNRQDVLLCGVYAQREALFGNIDHSRKVFDMTLSSIDGLPLDIRKNASLLYLWYAQAELANNAAQNPESSLRAIHILSCLGCGATYSPLKGQPSSLQQLRARQGFKDHIKALSSMWARGTIDDNSAALICSAALFEELTCGLTSALEILEHSFTMVLPERRRQSKQLEFLYIYYVKMLCKHHSELKFSIIWEAIVKGLDIYPLNAHLHGALVEMSCRYTSPNKLRWAFDDHCQKKPNVITLLYAMAYELSAKGSPNRIRRLFERALEDDKLSSAVVIWRSYIEFERSITFDLSAAKRVFFRAVHACPWSKKLWIDGFTKLESVLTVKEMSDLQEVMRDKELNLRTDIYEILLQEDIEIDA